MIKKMGETLPRDLEIRCNTFRNEDKMESNVNYEDNSHCYTIDNPESTIQSTSQCVYSEIKENDEDSDVEIEVLLLGMKDEEGNSIWNNDDDYDLTEEQEDYLLSEDIPEHYIKNQSASCCISDYCTVDDENNFPFVSETSRVNQNKVYDQEDSSNNISSNSNSDISDVKQNDILDTKDNDNMEDTSEEPAQEIRFKDSQYYSEIKSNISCCISNAIQNEQYAENSDYETSAKSSKILEIQDGVFYEEMKNSGEFNNKLFTDPANVTFLPDTFLSSKNTLTNSIMSENDEVVSNDESSAEEKFVSGTANSKSVLSEIMNSDPARKIYFDLLKHKTLSLSTSYNKYKNGFLLCTAGITEELQQDQSLKKEEIPSRDLFHCSEEKVINVLDNTKVSKLNIQPLKSFAAENETQFFPTRAKSPTEKLITSNSVPATNLNEDLRQSLIKEKNQDNILPPIKSKAGDKNMKDASPELCSTEENTDTSIDGLTFHVDQENLSCQFKDKSELRSGDVCGIFSRERQLTVSMKDLHDSQECDMRNQFSLKKEDTINQESKAVNKTFRKYPGSRFTETLNRHLYMETESMDFQATYDQANTVQCSRCKNIVPVADEADACHSESKFHKKSMYRKIQKLKTNFKSDEILLDLFSLNNKIVTNILSLLLSEQFTAGAMLTDIMKYLRKEMALGIATKLEQDIRNFLKAAVDAGIIQMKYRRYVLTRKKEHSGRRKTPKTHCKEEVPPHRTLRPRTAKKK